MTDEHAVRRSPAGTLRRAARRRRLLVVGPFLGLVALLVTNVTEAAEAPVNLGTAAAFAVLAGAGVTNTGPTELNGDLGSCPTPAITGFPPGIVNGTIHANDAMACNAKADLVIAYNDAASRAPNTTFPGPTDLVGMTLAPGVYRAPSLALSGTVTLDGQNDPTSVFIFQAASTVITAPNSTVALINGAQACNVFWQVGSSATLGVGSEFVGTVMALTAITANTNATVEGWLLARNASVTLDNNIITVPECAPAPTTTSTVPATTTSTVAPTTTSTIAATTTSTIAATTTSTIGATTTSTIAPTTTSTIGATTTSTIGATTTTSPVATTTTSIGTTTTTAPAATTTSTIGPTTTTAAGATTTTAVDATTTTTAVDATTTSTVAAATTTTAAGSGSGSGTGSGTTTSTTAGSTDTGSTTTTAAAGATTSTIGSGATTAGATTTSVAGGDAVLRAAEVGGTGSLARTGSSHWKLLVLAAIAMGVGVQLVVTTSRRRPVSSWF